MRHISEDGWLESGWVIPQYDTIQLSREKGERESTRADHAEKHMKVGPSGPVARVPWSPIHVLRTLESAHPPAGSTIHAEVTAGFLPWAVPRRFLVSTSHLQVRQQTGGSIGTLRICRSWGICGHFRLKLGQSL